MVQGKVIARKHENNRDCIGKGHSKPIIGTRNSHLELPSREIIPYFNNLISEHVCVQADSE